MDAEFVAPGDPPPIKWEVPADMDFLTPRDMDFLTPRELLGGFGLAWADAAVLQVLSAGRCDAAKASTDPDGYL